MNSYKIKSIDEQFITVEWTINSKITLEKLDARYLPSDADGLNAELTRLLAAMASDVKAPVAPEVAALVNKAVIVDVAEINSENITE